MSKEQVTQKARDAVKKAADTAVATRQSSTLATIKSYIDKDEVKKRFSDVLGKKAPQFLASITSLISSSTNFNGVDPNTIMSSALVAATLDLPINPNLGFAYIIPYNGRDGNKAQFQMGYKGFIQLALRSGQFQTINATEVYEGEVVGLNRLTGEVKLDEGQKKSTKVVGYAAYFRLINGFEKTLYMTVEKLEDHGKRFSKSYDKENGLWKKDFHSMAMKTVLKLLLSKYGILSVDMQKAIEVDQGVIKDDNSVEYVDMVPESLGDPGAEIIGKSKALKDSDLRLVTSARDVKALDQYSAAFNSSLTAGELTQADFDELMTELNERRKVLES